MFHAEFEVAHKLIWRMSLRACSDRGFMLQPKGLGVLSNGLASSLNSDESQRT